MEAGACGQTLCHRMSEAETAELGCAADGAPRRKHTVEETPETSWRGHRE